MQLSTLCTNFRSSSGGVSHVRHITIAKAETILFSPSLTVHHVDNVSSNSLHGLVFCVEHGS